MKITYRFIIAALAAAALVSCTKDIAADRQDTGLQDGVRTIAVSFAAQTKTTLDGLQPEFDDGDVIKVSNGSACEDVAVQIDPQGNAFFTTTLTGALKAVYPATAAKLNGNAIEGVSVPAIQTGRFADANICMANIDANATSATFHNETAILRFYVDESVDVRAICISSPNFITTESIEGLTSGTARDKKMIYALSDISINIKNLKNPLTLDPLHSTTDDPDKRLCYVAILPISNDDIGLVSISPTQDVNTEGRTQNIYRTVSIGKGQIANAFIPYYIKVRVGGTDDAPEYQRWSYCNLGAFLPEEAGYYYSWGNTDGHWKNGLSNGYSFTEENYAASMGNSLTGDIQATSQYDAAFNAWVKSQGGSGKWRMPTKGEFETLLSTKPSVTEEGLVVPGTGLKFPFAGLVDGNTLCTESKGYKAMAYWSSSIRQNSNTSAYYLFATIKPQTTTSSDARYYGMPIRPIYGDPVEEEEDSGLTIGKLTDGGTVE